MRLNSFFWIPIILGWINLISDLSISAEPLNFYTGEINSSTSSTFYDQLLSGNDLFETVYGTFNSTGLLLIGGAALLGAGLLASPYLPEPDNIEPWVHSKLNEIRNGPLKFVPKPGQFFKDTVAGIKNPVPVYKPASKPVTYSFDYTEDSAEKNYNKLWESYGTRKNYDEIWNSNDINTETVPGPYSIPGPPYKPSITYTTNGKSTTTPTNSSKKKKQIFIHVGQKDGDVTTTSNFDQYEDHKVSQVIEPVVKTITSAIRQRYNNQYTATNYDEATAQSKHDSLQAPNRRIDEFKDYDDTHANQNIDTGYPMSLDYTYPSSNELVTSPSIRIMNNNPQKNVVNFRENDIITKNNNIKSKNVQPSISSLMKLSDLRKIYNVPKPILKKKHLPRRKNKPSRYIYYKN